MYPNFTEDEWDRIVEQAFSPDAPEPPFSEEYRARRLVMEKEFAMKKKRSARNTAIKILAIAAAAAVITPTAVIAGVRLYKARMEQTNTYQRTLEVDPGDEVSEEIMALEIGWLPEDIFLDYDGKYRSTDENNDRSMLKMFYKIPDDGTFSEEVDHAVTEKHFTTAAGHQAFYIGYAEDVTEGGQLWITFEGTLYAAQLFVSGFSEEELLKIADNVTLVPADEETAGEWHPQSYYDGNAKDTSSNSRMEDFSSSYANMRPFAIGETISYLDTKDEHVDICVNSVTVQDNFDGLATDGSGFDMDYSAFLDANGTISTVRQHIQIGDWETSLDEVISEETVQQYVIKVNMTYTNTGDAPLEDITIFDVLFWLDGDTIKDFYHDADQMKVFHVQTEQLVSEYNAFSVYTDHESHKNNIVNVAPGESVDVECAFIVDEDWFGNLYLLCGSIATSDYEIASRPVLDLCDLRPE